MEHTVLVLYDGDCRFCRFGIDLVHRVDLYRALDFCPFHAVVGEVLHSAVDAARVVLEVLPLGRLAVTAGIHHGYTILARYRGVLGRYVPDRPAVVTVAATEPASLP